MLGGPPLGLMLCHHLEVLNKYEQVALHLHFVLVTGPSFP